MIILIAGLAIWGICDFIRKPKSRPWIILGGVVWTLVRFV